MSLRARIVAGLIASCERRSPDFTIGDPAAPYLRRWWLIPRNRFFNLYLHNIRRSDDDRALHDHPWLNLSIILRGGYLEIMPGIWKLRLPGSIVARRARAAHRLVLLSPASRHELLQIFPDLSDDCWTLFITGPRTRNWGFLCPQGWVPWQNFTAPGAKGQTGKGCGE